MFSIALNLSPGHPRASNDLEDTVNGRARIHQPRERVEKTRYRLPSPGVTLWQITGYQAEVWWLLIPAKRNEPANIPSPLPPPPPPPPFTSARTKGLVIVVGVPRVKATRGKKTRDECRSKSVSVAQCRRKREKKQIKTLVAPSTEGDVLLRDLLALENQSGPLFALAVSYGWYHRIT